jgi:hypothetical protein
MLAQAFNLPANPTAQEVLTRHLPFQLVGLALVLVTLYVLYLVCRGVAVWFKDTPTRPALPEPTTRTAPQPSGLPVAAALAAVAAARAGGARTQSIPAEVVAVITAAVAASVGRKHRILEVEKAGGDQWLSAWAIEGRFQHFRSHKLR